MRVVSRVLWLAKAVDFPGEYEDAYCVDEARGLAAVADGVSTGSMFSQEWARQLVQAVITEPPVPEDEAAFADWLLRQRRAWLDHVGTRQLNYFQRQKLNQCGGAYSTLLWLEIMPPETRPGESGRWRCHALGDCGLMHVRADTILQSFPITESEELKNDPLVLGSTNRQKDHFLQFRQQEGDFQPGDMFVLCTDAVLGWALKRVEAGEPPSWWSYWTMSLENWREEVQALRLDRKMRTDDTTVVLLALEEDLAEAPAVAAAVLEEPPPLPAEITGLAPGQDPDPAPATEPWPSDMAPATLYTPTDPA